MRKRAGSRAARIIVALGLAVAACGCAGQVRSAGSVTILVPWTGPEYSDFIKAIIKPFEASTKINVHVQETRALTTELDGDVRNHDLPNVVALPSIGAIDRYASHLQSLNGVFVGANYGAPWWSLMQVGTRHRVLAVPVKVDVKSLIWYSPPTLDPRSSSGPRTLPELLALSTSQQRGGSPPWCLALSSASTSGWPGTDWIADILLSKYGKTVYQQWVDGKLPWNSGPVKEAWLLWGQLLGNGKAIYGGSTAALKQSVQQLHPSRTGCHLAHGTLVDEGFRSTTRDGRPPKFGTDFGFFAFPPASPATTSAIQVSADFIGMFKATAAAKSLIGYLTSTTAQRAWIKPVGIEGFSADNKIQASAYPDQARRQIAFLLTSGQHELCFGASDTLPSDLSVAFDQAILDYLADPARLPTILDILTRVQTQSVNLRKEQHDPSPPFVCGRPPQGKRS